MYYYVHRTHVVYLLRGEWCRGFVVGKTSMDSSTDFVLVKKKKHQSLVPTTDWVEPN